MLTENEIMEANKELAAINDSINNLKKRSYEIEGLLNQDARDRVTSKICNGIENRDKVKVKIRLYGWETKEEVLYYGYPFMDRYINKANRTKSVKFLFFKVKKDGSISKNTREIWADSIVSMEKID